MVGGDGGVLGPSHLQDLGVGPSAVGEVTFSKSTHGPPGGQGPSSVVHHGRLPVNELKHFPRPLLLASGTVDGPRTVGEGRNMFLTH